MKLHHFSAGAFLALFVLNALADDASGVIAMTGPIAGTYTGTFEVIHQQAVNFTDTFAVNVPVGTFLADSAVETIDLSTPVNDIDFTGITLTDATHTVFSYTQVPTQSTPDLEVWELTSSGPITVTTPLSLSLTGVVNDSSTLTPTGAPVNASYVGSINLAAVPEPSVYALMGLGLLGVGFMSRRRVAVAQVK